MDGVSCLITSSESSMSIGTTSVVASFVDVAVGGFVDVDVVVVEVDVIVVGNFFGNGWSLVEESIDDEDETFGMLFFSETSFAFLIGLEGFLLLTWKMKRT